MRILARPLRLGVVLALSLSWPGTATATPLDRNFTETVFIDVDAPGLGISGMAWAPDGSNRLFYLKQDGTVRIIENGALLPTPFATMSPIRTGGEEGLIGLTFDPNFVDNHYVYVFVTSQNGNSEILRYTDVGDIGTTRTAIKSNLPNGGNHNGGGIAFGPDGKLYWAIGEGGQNVPLADLATLNSKIGRMNPDGTAPNDNPFFDGPGPNNDFIWARGFRNPYTMTFQPSTEKLWVNVVGTSAEQIFLVNRRDHGGYVQGDKQTEGAQQPPYIQPVLNYWEGWEERTVAAAGAVRSNGIVTITTTQPMFLFKPGCRVSIHGMPGFDTTAPHPPIIEMISPTQFTIAQTGPNATAGGGYIRSPGFGRVVLGGTFYDGTQFPAPYRDNFFWGDFSSNKVMRAVMGGPTQNKFASIDEFSHDITSYIDAAVGPDGALYYATYGGTFYKVRYNAPTQGIALSNRHVRMAEGGRAIVMASLVRQPAGGVTINVVRSSGDPDLSITGGAVLNFGPSDWDVPKPITITSAADGDSSEDVATFVASSTGLAPESIVVKATDSNNQALVLSTAAVNINEGSNGNFTVALARAPSSNVTVTTARTAGDTNVTVTRGASLTFTPGNYATPQTVTVSAANDADGNDDVASLTVSASGISPRAVSVNVKDSALKAPAITSAGKITAVVGALYTHTVTATGNPTPTFSLAAAPAGMTIHGTTGEIRWTPTAAGASSVTVRAANGVVPDARQTFTITVTADAAPTASLTAPKEGETISGEHAEFYGDCIDDVGCTEAQFFVDGQLSYTDKNVLNHYHHGGGHALFDTWLLPNGPHRLRFTVVDTAGKQSSKEIDVLVANTGDRPDAGTESDAGNEPRDASTSIPPNADASPNASDALPSDDAGCSCHTSRSPVSRADAIFALTGLVILAARRRSSPFRER